MKNLKIAKQCLTFITELAKERLKRITMEPFLKSAASGNVDQLLNNIKSKIIAHMIP